MFWNLMLMQVRPWILWLRVYLAICLPTVIYLQNMTGIIVLSVLVVGSALLPRPSVISRVDFSYHMVRGMYLELMGEAKLHSPLTRFLIGSMIMKVIVYLVFMGLFIYSIYLLWNQQLMLGSFLYYGLVALKMCLLSELANVSKNVATNSKWAIIIDDKE